MHLQQYVDIGDSAFVVAGKGGLFNKNQRACSNYRPITLLSFHEKVYSRVVDRRVRLFVEFWIEEEQYVFGSGGGMLDQL